MKKERMSILNMLEKGIITAQEAERLLLALNGTAKIPEREGVNDVVNQALNKAGSAINTFAKAVGQQAEKLEPKVHMQINCVKKEQKQMKKNSRIWIM